MTAKLFALAALLALAVGCNDKLCARKSDCGGGDICSAAGVCELTTDAGLADSSATTSTDGSVDATASDAAVDATIDGGT